jgi:hypothetical protein
LEIVKYRDWVLEVDRQETEAVYQQVEKNGTQSCGCDSCQYFETIADEVFPDEVKALLRNLGVDIKKNFEVNDLGDGVNEYDFEVRFHFKGNLIEGNDCYIPFNNNGYRIKLLPINDTFEIGFTENGPRSFFNEEKELIQIHIMTRCHRT